MTNRELYNAIINGTITAEVVAKAREEIAKLEADNGKYKVEDDGLPEPELQLTDAERIAELEEALELLLSGVTE